MTILNQYEILENVTPIWWYIVAIILVVSVVYMIAISNKTSHPVALAVIMCCVILADLVWCYVVYGIVHKEDVPTGCYRYECTIDDDASFTDILEEYDVIEQRGEIWVLEDKNG